MKYLSFLHFLKLFLRFRSVEAQEGCVINDLSSFLLVPFHVRSPMSLTLHANWVQIPDGSVPSYIGWWMCSLYKANNSQATISSIHGQYKMYARICLEYSEYSMNVLKNFNELDSSYAIRKKNQHLLLKDHFKKRTIT